MPYPDYGTPGNPNMDPYYVSPENEHEAETARAAEIADIVADLKNDISEMLVDAEKLLKQHGAGLKFVGIDVDNLGVTVMVS